MKKFFLASVFAVSASAAFSQANIQKGDWLVGGNVGFASSKQGDYKTTTFNFSPNAGYFFINQLAGGLRATISSEKEEYGTSEEKSNGYSLAPFVRYYFLPATQKVNVFADASFGFGQSKKETSGAFPFTSKYNFTNLGLRAGAAIFLTPATALEIGAGYNSLKIDDVDDRDNTFAIEVGFQIHLPGGAKK